ncbi:MAG: beta-galactosidase, partial [Armatimonadetes bacterium]|nr:beta-galactosidase [Armatimonadota bacterium]
MRCRALVLFCVLSGSVVGAATTAQEVAEDHSLATSLVTPHKPWGRGYVRGPLKALFFIFAGHYGGEWDEPGTRLREVNELAQRFDLQADAVLFAAGPNKTWAFHGGRLGEERAAKLLETPYQLYVFGGFGLDKLPGKLQFAVLEQVAKGAGWLQCGGDAVPYLAERRKVDPAPASLVGGLPQIDGQATAALAAAYRLREGRAVWLRYPAWALTPSKPFSWRGLTDYDSWMLLVGRAALWAAGREPAVQIDRIGADGALRLPARTTQRAAIALSTRGDSTALTIAPALRRPSDGWSAALKEFSATVAPGKATELAVELPPLRADDYYLDLVVRSSRGVEAFGAGTLLVESPAGIESVSVDRKFAEAGETATATATLRGTPPAGSAVRFVLRDAHQRAIEQAEQPVRAGQAAYLHRFTPDALSTIELRVEAVLLSGGQELEKKQTALAVPKRRQGRHNFVMWDTPNDVLGLYAWQQMKAAGYEVALIGSMGGPKAAPPVLAAADVSIVPYSTRIMDEKDADGVMKPVCWNHDPAAAEYVAKIVENQRQLREHGVFVYSLGDEGTTLGCCVHPDCLAAYRRYLQSQYREIAALNASWGSSYASFDEVTLLDLKDNMESATRDKTPARWYDRQAFARYNLMQFVSRFVKGYAELDPKALTGFEGTGGFGDDFDALCGINTFYGPYPSIGDDLVRSTMAREKVRSNWMGYSKTGDALSDAAWRMVMKGMDSIWWWMWDGIGSWRGLVRPTLDFWPATEDLNAEMKPVREGLGDLVINSEVVHSGIAVFYSVASALAGQIDSAGGFSAAQPTHEAWTELTYDLGLDFRYLTAAAVRGGQLDGREFKVLLLPMSQALAPEEAAAIRAFVEAGGTVIADVRPGIYDGHCRPLEQGALDDLFGIKRGGRGKAVDAEVTLTAGPGGKLNATLGKVKVDPEVAAAGAQALGQAG